MMKVSVQHPIVGKVRQVQQVPFILPQGTGVPEAGPREGPECPRAAGGRYVPRGVGRTRAAPAAPGGSGTEAE